MQLKAVALGRGGALAPRRSMRTVVVTFDYLNTCTGRLRHKISSRRVWPRNGSLPDGVVRGSVVASLVYGASMTGGAPVGYAGLRRGRNGAPAWGTGLIRTRTWPGWPRRAADMTVNVSWSYRVNEARPTKRGTMRSDRGRSCRPVMR